MTKEIKQEEIKELLKYISGEWDYLVYNSREGHSAEFTKDLNAPLYLPYDYIIPNKEKFDVMFYWDSYFIILGLKYDNRTDLINNIIGNCLYEIAKYGKVLNANKKKWATRSQMPYLTLMMRESYDIYSDKKWLKEAFGFAKKEYKNYWLNDKHLTETGLSRYYDESGADETHTHAYKSRAEASWDMSPRFDDEDIHNLAPIDLNCNLYQYEKDFGFFAEILGQNKEALEWQEKAEQRKEIINNLMWDETEGLFFDYNFKTEKRKKIRSLASYQALFAGLADKKQADKLKDNLKLFQTEYGLAACSQGYYFTDRQWNWPMVWAPLQYVCYKGLKDYGYEKEAKDIGLKFIELVYINWIETGKIWEKYNGEKGNLEVSYDRYSNQSGFGWTNAVAEVFMKEIYKI